MKKTMMAFVVLLVCAFMFGRPAMAQESATPTAIAAVDCTVDPIDPDTYNAAIEAAAPAAPQPVVAVGDAANEATIAGVTDAIAQSIACTNIGDLGRLLAIIDPSYAPTLLGVPEADVPAAVEAAAATSQMAVATPLVDDYDNQGLVSNLIGVSDVVVLPDDSVAAVATLQREGYPVSVVTIYLRYDATEERYIITNYTFHPDEATPTA